MTYSCKPSKRRRIINVILCVLFALFAFVQLNDPDPVKWVVIYASASIVSLLSNYIVLPKAFIYAVVIGYLIFAGVHLSYFLDWLGIEEKSELFGKMVYEKPHLEGTREFLGLLIAAAGVLFQLRNTNKQLV
tara:strand:- start:2921 stop:3316 length:396 start_codon:yes stop_codon:yes gene_type:complete